MVACRGRNSYDRRMLLTETTETTETPYTRTLTLELPESDWRALRDAEPDAVGWLQRQIRDRLSSTEDVRQPAPAPVKYHEFSVEDEY